MTHPDLQAFGRGLVAFLGAGWKLRFLDDSRNIFYIDNEDGRSLNIRAEYNGPYTKVSVSGVLPGRRSWPRINVSTTRSSQIVTRDIERRLLGEYNAAYLAAVEAEKVAAERARAKEQRLAEYKEVFPGAYIHGGGTFYFDSGSLEGIRPDGGVYRLELRDVSHEMLLKIAAMWREKS